MQLLSGPAEREARVIVDRLLDETARSVETRIAYFRCVFTIVLILLNLADGTSGPPMFIRSVIIGVAMAALLVSLVVVKEARKEKTDIRKLANSTIRVDAILLLTPAVGYWLCPVDSSYLTLPGIPILYMAMVSSGLRLFRSTLAHSIVVYSIVALGWVGVDFLVGTTPEPIEMFYFLFNFGSSAFLAAVVCSQTRRLTLSGATNALSANVDGLTGVKNRRFLRGYLDEAVSAASTGDQPLSVVMADIDHFKQINDTLGHGVGDTVLKAVAEAMSRTLREGDLVARYGGEEFSLVLRGAEESVAAEVAERVRQAVANTEVAVDGDDVSVTVSLGVAQYKPADGTAHGLLKRADEALYEAKNAGRNCVRTAEA
jgi:diguanylate cyclase (GGDEF)-like protein